MNWWKKRGERLADEIQAHIDFETQENIEAGMLPEEARHAAMRKFGNVLLARERSREMWGWLWVDRLLQDLRYALRQVWRSPGFAATVIGTLSLGIGAAAAMFTVVDRLLLEPVRYRDAGRLVSIRVGDAQNAYGAAWFDIEQWQKESRSFEQMALVGSMSGRNYLHGKSDLLEVSGRRVSANLFSTLGVEPELGRGFLPEAPGFAPGKNAGTIVLSDACGERLSAPTGRFSAGR